MAGLRLSFYLNTNGSLNILSHGITLINHYNNVCCFIQYLYITNMKYITLIYYVCMCVYACVYVCEAGTHTHTYTHTHIL